MFTWNLSCMTTLVFIGEDILFKFETTPNWVPYVYAHIYNLTCKMSREAPALRIMDMQMIFWLREIHVSNHQRTIHWKIRIDKYITWFWVIERDNEPVFLLQISCALNKNSCDSVMSPNNNPTQVRLGGKFVTKEFT